MQRKSSASVGRRFRGADGRRRLQEELVGYPLLAGNMAASRALCRYVRLAEMPQDGVLITQGQQDNDLYILISGSARILVNGREIAVRQAGDHVGEMSMLDRTAVRSATVVTREASLVARISEVDFARVANRHPSLWRKLAVTVAHRLRERNRFHPPPHTVPVIFIGSSTEGLPAARSLHRSLRHRGYVARIWTDGVFQCSKATLEDLMAVTLETDYAILVLTPDDVTISRGKTKVSPRDNIVFELGLFMGSIRRERTYMVAPDGLEIKIPTDLLGVKLLKYRRRRGRTWAYALRSIRREVFDLIEKHGCK